MSNIEKYTYSTISSPEIRLLQLHATEQPTDPLRCAVRYRTSEFTNGDYNALSYTWGEAIFSKSLLIVTDDRDPSVAQSEYGLEIRITTNLDTALRRIRTDVPDGLLWVDAVCINQADNWERTSQVQMMGKIFSEAQWVVIWTGLDHADRRGARCLEILARLVRAELGFDDNFPFLDNSTGDDLHQQLPERKLQGLDRRSEENAKNGRSSMMDRPDGCERECKPGQDDFHLLYRDDNEKERYIPYQNTGKGEIISKHADNQDYGILSSFFRRPYFTRRWIIQEVSLARNIVIYCGATVLYTDVMRAIFRSGGPPES